MLETLEKADGIRWNNTQLKEQIKASCIITSQQQHQQQQSKCVSRKTTK